VAVRRRGFQAPRDQAPQGAVRTEHPVATAHKVAKEVLRLDRRTVSDVDLQE